MAITHRKFSSLLIVGTLAGATTACEAPTGVQAGNTAVEIVKPGDAVCDPFGGPEGGASRFDDGLFGELFYLEEDQPRYEQLSSYFEHGQKAELDLYFSQLNTPTRPFDQGFVTQDGTVFKTPAGDTVYEWFGLRFETEIQLSHVDEPGWYQFAILSDDGTSLRIDEGDGFGDLIRHEQVTPSRLSCASRAVYLDAGTRLPAKLEYFQGPRYHIALMLLFRKVDGPTTGLSDSACGKSGNETWFDYRQNPTVPKATWLGLLERGWKVLNPKNFRLPNHVRGNPCDGTGFPPVY